MAKTSHSRPNDKIKNDIIVQGKKQMFRNQLQRTSYVQLFFSTVQFIDVSVWIVQLILVIGAYFFLSTEFKGNAIVLAQSMTGVLLFSLLFFTYEVFKSFSNSMWELEQTFKFDLKQNITMKLLLFGAFDLLVIMGMSLVASGQFQISLFRFSLFLIVPFNLFCIVLFSIFTLLRNKFRNLFWGISGGILFFLFFGVSKVNDNVYKKPLLFWIVAGVISSTILMFLVRRMLQSYRPRRTII